MVLLCCRWGCDNFKCPHFSIKLFIYRSMTRVVPWYQEIVASTKATRVRECVATREMMVGVLVGTLIVVIPLTMQGTHRLTPTTGTQGTLFNQAI